jgi:hypothetical protein
MRNLALLERGELEQGLMLQIRDMPELRCNVGLVGRSSDGLAELLSLVMRGVPCSYPWLWLGRAQLTIHFAEQITNIAIGPGH